MISANTQVRIGLGALVAGAIWALTHAINRVDAIAQSTQEVAVASRLHAQTLGEIKGSLSEIKVQLGKGDTRFSALEQRMARVEARLEGR